MTASRSRPRSPARTASRSGAWASPSSPPWTSRSFTYVWCRNTPGQGERGVALAFVRLDRACLAAKGRALGTGYVDVPGS